VLPRRELSAEEQVRLREELTAVGFEGGALHIPS
jgi:hypothetical protein